MRALRLACTLALALAPACSVTRFQNESCTDGAQCRKAFGFGAVCSSSGYCESAVAPRRCESTVPDDLFKRPELYGDAIVIGSLMDRSNATQVVRENAIKMAVAQADDLKAVDGRRVAVVLCDIAKDSTYDALARDDAAIAGARFLSTQLGVSVIVGPSSSGDTQKVWEALRGKDTVVISPAATGPALLTLEAETSEANPGYLWRVAAPDTFQGEIIANDMIARGVKNVAIIHQADAYGEGLNREFHPRFTAGGRGNATIETITADSQIGEVVARVGGGPATEVLFVSSQQPWVVTFLRAAAGIEGFKTKTIFLTESAAAKDVFNEKGAADAKVLFSRIRGTRPSTPGNVVFKSFVSGYRGKYRESPEETIYSGHSYDAAWLALYGSIWSLAQEKRITGAGVARGLRKVSSGTRTEVVPSSWPAVVTAFRAGKSVNLDGASGAIDFDPVSRSVIADFDVWALDETGAEIAFKVLETKTPGQ